MLSNVMDSYWNMLPPELQDFILLLKRNQEVFEEEKKRVMEKLGKEIVLYKELKDKWALGHIRCVVKPSWQRPVMSIYGNYVDLEGVNRKKFIAFSFERALQRVNHVKSFL